MKKKVALMTWHHAENYGTAFQAYALKLLIEQHGFEVNLVDYHRLRAPIKLRTLKEISTGFVRRLFQKFKWNKEKNAPKSWLEYPNATYKLVNIENYKEFLNLSN